MNHGGGVSRPRRHPNIKLNINIMAKAKLHEIIAVEMDRRKTAQHIVEETITTFNKKVHHFVGSHTQYTPFAEEDAATAEESAQEMVDTVMDKLLYMAKPVIRAIDVVTTKDVTNQLPEAVASIVVDGQELTAPLPGVTLLMLEGRLKELKPVFQAIPTLSPGRKWEVDPDKGPDVFRDMNPDTKFRTKKTVQHKVLTEPTEHHPAQIERWAEDEKVGKVTGTTWSAMFTPARKSEILENLDKLLAAVKQARMRANCVEVKQTKVGADIMNFILGGTSTAEEDPWELHKV